MVDESIDHENDAICNTIHACPVSFDKLGSETTRLWLMVRLEFRTFYGIISMVYRSIDHEKVWSNC